MKITPVSVLICLCLVLSAFLGGMYLGRNMRGDAIEISALTTQPSRSSTPAASTAGQVDQKVNINTADLYTLMSLDGIGETYAQRIIDYREEKGAFASIEEIMEVSGISESRFEKIRDYITVEDTE